MTDEQIVAHADNLSTEGQGRYWSFDRGCLIEFARSVLAAHAATAPEPALSEPLARLKRLADAVDEMFYGASSREWDELRIAVEEARALLEDRTRKEGA